MFSLCQGLARVLTAGRFWQAARMRMEVLRRAQESGGLKARDVSARVEASLASAGPGRVDLCGARPVRPFKFGAIPLLEAPLLGLVSLINRKPGPALVELASTRADTSRAFSPKKGASDALPLHFRPADGLLQRAGSPQLLSVVPAGLDLELRGSLRTVFLVSTAGWRGLEF